jgi:hypothetical protein
MVNKVSESRHLGAWSGWLFSTTWGLGGELVNRPERARVGDLGLTAHFETTCVLNTFMIKRQKNECVCSMFPKQEW